MARILLVEDDIDVRRLLEHVPLTEQNYEVAAVANLANALTLLERQPLGLVIADVNLLDDSGLNAADVAKRKGIAALIVAARGLSPKPRRSCKLQLPIEAATRKGIARRGSPAASAR